MLAGCYTLDLYCSNEGTFNIWRGSTLYDEFGHEYREFPHIFTNEYGSVCRSTARKLGWILGRHTELCPKCSGKLK